MTVTFRDGVIVFPVSAYIHSGIALSLGDGSHYPDQRWVVTRGAAYMWTDQKRFEELCGEWMTIYDESTQSHRKAKSFDEFKTYLRKIAESELALFGQYLDGDCYGYKTEVRQEYKKVYPDGREVNAAEYVDGDDSWGGYYPDPDSGILDLDAPKGDDIEWFAGTDCAHFVGDKYKVPEGKK